MTNFLIKYQFFIHYHLLSMKNSYHTIMPHLIKKVKIKGYDYKIPSCVCVCLCYNKTIIVKNQHEKTKKI